MKKILILYTALSCFSIHAQLAIGYNAGVFQNELKYFEILNYENGLRNEGEIFIYKPLLHGLHVGIPLLRAGDKEDGFFTMEYAYSVKGTRSNLAVINNDPITKAQYKIRIATHSVIFAVGREQWKIGFGIDGSVIRTKKFKIVGESKPDSPLKWDKFFENELNVGGTIFISYRPEKVRFIEFRPYYNWQPMMKMDLANLSYYSVAIKFSNVGLNVNVLISKREK
jgi:hypothetical protein